MQLPGPVRAFVGLIAVTAEEARHLPDRAIELPMLAVSSALQMSLRAQQRYARLAARGDDLINRRPPGDEPPPWATFDEPVAADELRAAGLDDADPAVRARAASQLLDELFGEDGAAADPTATYERSPVRRAPGPAGRDRVPAKKDTPNTASATKKATAAKKPTAAKKATTVNRANPAKKATPAKKASAAKKASGGGTTKTISAPRHTAPSRFDTVQDD